MQMKMLSCHGRISVLYVELTSENLKYLAKATLAQYKKACEILGDPPIDSQSETSGIEESPIEESNIDESPVVSFSASDSAPTEAAAVDNQHVADSVLAMLCKK